MHSKICRVYIRISEESPREILGRAFRKAAPQLFQMEKTQEDSLCKNVNINNSEWKKYSEELDFGGKF